MSQQTERKTALTPDLLQRVLGEDEEDRRVLRTLLGTLVGAGIKHTDLVGMLRGQVLLPARGRNPNPCQAGIPAHDPRFKHLPLAPRDVPQSGLKVEDEAGVVPSRLMCPLHERSLAGEWVPCGALEQKPAAQATRELETACQGLIQQSQIRPCLVLQAGIATCLPEFLGLLPGEPWPAGDLSPQQLAALSRALLTAEDEDGEYPQDDEDDEDLCDEDDEDGGEKVRGGAGDRVAAHPQQDRLRFLLASGRLSESELREMADHLLFATDRRWLPCRDDPQRDHLAVSRQRPPSVPAARYLCPLQVRGLRGDATVPCSEALALKPAESLLRLVRDKYPPDALKRRRPPQPVYWSHSTAQPGGTYDVVQVLEIRPCQALGEVILRGVVWLVEQSIDQFLRRKEVGRPKDPPASPAA